MGSVKRPKSRKGTSPIPCLLGGAYDPVPKAELSAKDAGGGNSKHAQRLEGQGLSFSCNRAQLNFGDSQNSPDRG